MTEFTGVVHRRDCPYLGLEFYTEELGEWFFGRTAETETIITNLRAARLTLLHADSGVGKSSLLRAGVWWRLNQLAELNREARKSPAGQGSLMDIPVVFSSWKDDPVHGLCSAIGDAVKPFLADSREPELPANQLDAAIRAAADSANAGLIIILDQFEEYFLYKSREMPRERFASQLAGCINQADLPVNFLIAIREDAYAGLGGLFEGRMANVYANYLQIEYLDRAAAEKAIRAPLAVYNGQATVTDQVEIEDRLVQAVLKQVRAGGAKRNGSHSGASIPAGPDRVVTPVLQLVMKRIWDRERTEGSHKLRLSTLDNMEGVDSIVDTHLNNALHKLTVDERQTAIDMFDYLVTPSGGKVAESVPDLATRTRHSEQQVDGVMEKLDDARIVRSVPAPPGQDATQFRRYEIFHDVLAPAIIRTIGARAEQRRTRRLRRVAMLTASLLIVALALGAFFGYLWHEAVTARKIAESRQLAAAAQANVAHDPELSALLAVRALRIHYTSQAEAALREALPQIQDVKTFQDHTPVEDAVFDPADKDNVASAGKNGVSSIWNVTTGHRLLLLPKFSLARDETAIAISFNPAGTKVAVGYVGGRGSQVVLFDSRTGKVLQTAEIGSFVTDAKFVDNSELAIATQQNVVLWYTNRGSACCDEIYNKPATTIAIDPKDPLEFAAATANGTVVWKQGNDPSHVKLTRLNAGQQGLLDYDAEFSPDGSQVVTADGDSEVRVYNRFNGKVVRTFNASRGVPHSAAFSPGGQWVVTGFSSGATRIWSNITGLQLMLLSANASSVSTVSFSADGREVVTAGEDGAIRVFYSWPRGLQHAFASSTDGTPSKPEPAYSADYSYGGILIVDGSGDAYLYTTVGADYMRSIVPPSHGVTINSARFNQQGTEVVTADSDGSVDLWPTFSSSNVPVRLPKSIHVNGPAWHASFSPGDGSKVVIVTNNNTAVVASTRTGQILHTLNPGHSYLLSVAVFSPSSHQIVTGDDNGQAEVWNAITGTLIRSLGKQGSAINDVAFNRSGSKLVTAALDGRISIWAVPGYGPPLSFIACPSPNTVAFSPDGSKIVVACDDGTVPVFDTTTGQQLTDLSDPGLVNSAAFSTDGKSIITAFGVNSMGGVRIWSSGLATTSLATLKRIATHRITRTLTPAERQKYLAGTGE